MEILVIGSPRKLGSALCQTRRGHHVITTGRSAGDFRADITDPTSVAELYDDLGAVDAVACAAGVVPYKTIQDMTAADDTSAYEGKIGGQMELVRQGIHHIAHIAPNGSFTVITGILARSPIVTGTAASMANGAIEAVVRAAAIEIAPQRVNAVSPTVFTEAQGYQTATH